ncbi:MAG: hypothetical protein IKL10_02685 [Clostridia bacterium]|nr:hypothetical protein [Clostridia bacterium]
MNLKKHKIAMLIVSVILLIGITVSAVATVGGKKPSVQSGSFENLIADRIEVTLENTDFTLNKSSSDTETFTLTFYLTMKKTQADFYALINNFTFSDISYDNIVFTALNEKTQDKTLNDLFLTAQNGEPDTFKWQVDVTLSVKDAGKYTSLIKIDYTSGMTQNTATQKLMEIPITITVN